MEQYIKDAVRSNIIDKVGVYDRLNHKSIIDILHGAIGLSTESGELLDAVKKHLFYGRELDVVNIKEELGDLFWYMALICNALDVSFEELQEINIAKLKARYPEGFTEEKAYERDLEKERKILESN